MSPYSLFVSYKIVISLFNVDNKIKGLLNMYIEDKQVGGFFYNSNVNLVCDWSAFL